MSTSTDDALLVRDLYAGYGNRPVLKGISMMARPGEIVAIIGHNGAGKSTFLKCVFGLLRASSGEIRINGREVLNTATGSVIAAGASFLPQGNRVFESLTVRQNLRIAGLPLQGDEANKAFDSVLSLFPALTSRLRQRAGDLSGGEKQMVALASTLMSSPRLLLLDEPSLGLAAPLVTETLRIVREYVARIGLSTVIVEQKVREVLTVSDRVYVFRNGEVSFSGDAKALLLDENCLRKAYL